MFDTKIFYLFSFILSILTILKNFCIKHKFSRFCIKFAYQKSGKKKTDLKTDQSSISISVRNLEKNFQQILNANNDGN